MESGSFSENSKVPKPCRLPTTHCLYLSVGASVSILVGSVTGQKEKLGHRLNLRHEYFVAFQKQCINYPGDKT